MTAILAIMAAHPDAATALLAVTVTLFAWLIRSLKDGKIDAEEFDELTDEVLRHVDKQSEKEAGASKDDSKRRRR